MECSEELQSLGTSQAKPYLHCLSVTRLFEERLKSPAPCLQVRNACGFRSQSLPLRCRQFPRP